MNTPLDTPYPTKSAYVELISGEVYAPSAGSSAYDVFEGDTLEERAEKFFNLGDDRNIAEVFVRGRRVHPTVRCCRLTLCSSRMTSLGFGA
jgi:hypothetical protein